MTWLLFIFGLLVAVFTPQGAKALPDDNHKTVAVVILVCVGIALMVIATLIHQIGGAA